MIYCLSHPIELMVDIGVRNHVLKEDFGESTTSSLRIFPISILGRYVWRSRSTTKPYVGFGVAGYWARFASDEIIRTSVSGPEAIGTFSVAHNYSGFGLLGGTGFIFEFFRDSYGDLGIRYDLTGIGNSQKGGLGNIGGVRFHLRAIMYF